MQHLGLSPQTDGQHTTDYDVHLSPAIANEFAAAAFRFGHSQIQGLVQQIDGPGKNIDFKQLSSITFNPFSLYVDGAMAGYVRGETSQKLRPGYLFSAQVTGQLFRGKEATGLDLVSINIQRGRDHGVPAYTRARMACGLPSVKNFTDLAKDMDGGALKKIEAVYSHVDDIDLYTGGLAERPIQDGLVGPTFACIIADQFLRLKKGDRYWYETDEKPQAFSKESLAPVLDLYGHDICLECWGEAGGVKQIVSLRASHPPLPSAAHIYRGRIGRKWMLSSLARHSCLAAPIKDAKQLAVIHKTSLARILCDNIPELASIQRWPLRVFSTANPRLPCSSFSIPKIYLDPWDESTGSKY
ncbi:Peroxidasin [Chionoecetes opilio]|uniref:Peroxidasin n=1 Tax=Chionoecetes opilio TaxID=41210 RepID=A0A8J4Y891_CHIOP|nr:Peroxidasin [Chionoecetes opilio]